MLQSLLLLLPKRSSRHITKKRPRVGLFLRDSKAFKHKCLYYGSAFSFSMHGSPTDPGLRENSIFGAKTGLKHPRCTASKPKIKMAGKKKGRKRPAKRSLKSSEKRDPIQNVQETSACVEEKKPKLNDESEKRDEQLSVDKLETVDSENNDSVGDLQEEESKYVPPFSRKRVLKRSGAPPSPAARPKRSWRGVQQTYLKQAQPAECPADIDVKQSDVCTVKNSPDSPKVCFITVVS